MRDFLKRLLSPAPAAQPDLLALRSELQRLRLALDEATARSQRLEDELSRQRLGDEARRAAAQEKLLTDLAAPAAQFLLQLDLAGRQGKPVQAADALAVARSLLNTLASYGLQPAEIAGQACPFDPEHHAPLAAGVAIQPGQLVLIRVPGFTYQGRRLRKAGVSLPEN